jgi:LL-diaminopimelate aminotransferase
VKLAERMGLFSTHFFAAQEARIRELQAAGKDVIRLDIGSPDLPPAPHILAALTQAAGRADSHGYQPHAGPLALRQAWAEMYWRLYGVEIDPDRQLTLLLGSKEGIFHLAMALVDPGQVVLVPDPGYPTYARGALFAGGEPHFLPLTADRHYLPDLDAIPPQVIRRARMLWLNYPNNPTGATATLDFFARAVAFGRAHGLLVCHDAAYAQVTFEDYQAPSLLQVPGASEVALEFNTLSKSHNMAGWRVGAALGNPQALQALYRLKTNLDSGHFGPVLSAATAALAGDQGWLPARNAVYQQRRDLVLGGLRAVGLQPETPRAALYVWCPTPPGVTALAFAAAALERAQVSLAPGTVFGAHGEGYVRLALTAPADRLAQAMERLAEVQTWF